MNTRSPITTLGGQQAPGRANFRLTVITMFALHGVFLAGLLLQGCKRPSSGPPAVAGGQDTTTQTTSTYDLAPQTNQQAFAAQQATQTVTSATPYTPGVGQQPTIQPLVTEPELAAQVAPPPPTEYVVKPGDTPAKIARAHGVTLKAFMEANAGLDPRKLKIGQQVTVPPPAPGEKQQEGATSVAGGQDAVVHVVKSGENLTKIARRYGVTVSELRAANNLKTDRINAGQKLKIPAAEPKAGTAPAGSGSETRVSPLVTPPAPGQTAATAAGGSVP